MTENEAELFRVIADALPAVLAYIDSDERYRFANRHYSERYGRTSMVGRTAIEVIGEESYTRVAPYIRRALGGETVKFETEVLPPIGEPLWVSATYVPHRAADGAIRGFAVLSEDITERKRIEQEIRATNAKLDAIFGASPTALILLEADLSVRLWNGAAERIFGWPAHDVVGQKLRLAPAHEEQLARVVGGEVVDALETVLLGRDGELPVTLWAAPVRGSPADGADPQCLLIVSDATARRRDEGAQRFLTEAGRVLGSSFDHQETLEQAARLVVPDYGDWCFVDLLDDSGQNLERVAIGTANPRDPSLATIRRRFPVEEVAGYGVARALSTGKVQLTAEIDDEALRSMARDDRQLAILRAIGMRSLAIVPLMVRGRPIGLLSIASSSRALDAHDCRVIEELARSAAAAIDSARLFSAERRARLRIARLQQVTAAFSRARTAQEVAEVACRIGAEAMEASAGALWLAEDGVLDLAGAWGEVTFSEPFRRLPNGEVLPPDVVMETGAPIWIENGLPFGCVPLMIAGKLAGAIMFAHPRGHRYDEDERSFYLTLAIHCAQALERARLLDEARAATHSAQTASRVKDEFLAMLGHELRNPLAPILTALQVMTRNQESTEKSSMHERSVIERQVRHLARLVDDLLDVSRITAGRIQIEKTRIDLVAVIDRAVEMTRPVAADRRLEVDIAPALAIEGDETRLAQIFANLISNAARHTDRGGVIRVEAAEETGAIVVRVRDDGSGIEPALLPKIFELFTQGPQAAHRPQGGLGLGLAIVKSLVALHGGEVSIESAGAGQGTLASVRLPSAPGGFAVASGAAREPEIAPVAATGRVLIVDDNVDAAELLMMALNMTGYETRMAHDAEAALALATELEPALAVLDIGLPGMDGVELGLELRKRDPSIRLIALTGYGQAKDRERTRAAGFDDHMVKPVDLDDLESAIARLLSR